MRPITDPAEERDGAELAEPEPFQTQYPTQDTSPRIGMTQSTETVV